MAEPKQCTSLGKATSRTVALAFDLTGTTIVDSPSMLKKILEDKTFQTAVADALKKTGQEIMKEQAKGKPVAATDALKKFGSAAGKAAASKGSGLAAKQVKASPEFKRLEASLKELGCAFDKTPVGAFVNKNKTLLIIVGAVGALGGAVGLYYTKSGDFVGENAAKLLSGMEIKKIGAVTLKANKVEFKPSERKVAVELGAAGKWDTVKASFALGAAFKKDQLSGVNGKGNVVVDVAPRWSISADAAGAWARGEAGKPDAVSVNTAIGVKHKFSKKASLSFQVIGSFAQTEMARKGGVGGGVKFNAKNPFGPKTGASISLDARRGVMQQGMPGGFGPTRSDNSVNLKVILEF